MAERVIAPAIPSFETAAYFEAANRDVLLMRRCDSCGEPHHYPRSLCPFCFSDNTRWQEISGAGTIYSYSVMHRSETPYCIAYVTLDEGPTMMTNIVDVDLATITIGARVRAVFKPSANGQKVPMFTLTESD